MTHAPPGSVATASQACLLGWLNCVGQLAFDSASRTAISKPIWLKANGFG